MDSTPGSPGGSSRVEAKLLNEASVMVPNLTEDRHKGQAGRIGVIGGSMEYSGAPYFAAISALRVGCDLSHVFCCKEAGPVIKSYSPELIVHPVLDLDNAISYIKPVLSRLHVLVIGPGLGRDPKVLHTVACIIDHCRHNTVDQKKPLVIDADGLHLITEQPELVVDYPGGLVLTPNAVEFTRLASSILRESWSPAPESKADNLMALASCLGPRTVIVLKGSQDLVASPHHILPATGAGSGRRCGGQGDLLSGSLGTFLCWALVAGRDVECKIFPEITSQRMVVAAYGACRLTKECNRRAFTIHGRSMLVTDMIDQIHNSFEALFGQ
ncbi:ATP-dependent (S)-NAD(P)H-hydrate dehydratase [Frankliniella fusca]|uniref:ATP-dependent (S)-NAD(P)H-hydrate dehydratase n=1 Tax=Frankliniella fusca TaxID=407009 RepID=A0AAE1GWI0_9NEOP|nr:ATP-dependent (S)-NAD(P)H-hydrate dehydratase [Frankliniella fusca]